jgi:hypothetical protein
MQSMAHEGAVVKRVPDALGLALVSRQGVRSRFSRGARVEAKWSPTNSQLTDDAWTGQ